jgi:hypothetical protein
VPVKVRSARAPAASATDAVPTPVVSEVSLQLRFVSSNRQVPV